MTWLTLGSLVPSFDWVTLHGSSSGELFRCVFTIPQTGHTTKSWIRIRQLFSESAIGVTQSRVIYPSVDPIVFDLIIPTELRAAGYVRRSLQVKRFARYRTFCEPNYSISLQEWL